MTHLHDFDAALNLAAKHAAFMLASLPESEQPEAYRALAKPFADNLYSIGAPEWLVKATLDRLADQIGTELATYVECAGEA